ncbi:secretin N-terminal domain-containing protein [Polaromonas sp. YR568]|uniref:secretin N-terminal domain-containing protein n=1 Tax=Polaromonas sp. YR568 TaxID=1855301 RepID=UPI003137AC88
MNKKLRILVAALPIVLAGCASYQNLKGKTEIVLDQPEDGVQSLGSAAQKAPRNPEYQVDYLTQRDKYAKEFLAQADAFRLDGKLAEARAEYERVLRLDAGNARATQGLIQLQQDARHEKVLIEGERLLEQGKHDAALERASQVLESNAKSRRALKLKDAALNAKTERQIAQDKARAARSILDAPVTLQFRDATLRIAFEAISKSTGMNILFDREVKQEAKVTIFVRDISVIDAIDLILLQNQLDKRIVNTNTLLIYPATASKQAEYEDLTIRSFRVTNTDIKYLSNMVKSMLKLKEVAADEKTGVLVIRDTPERLRLAEKLIAVHDMPDPEIMLEVQVLEVSRSRNSNIGIKPPGSFTVTTPGTTAAPLTLGQLNNLTSNDLLVSPLSATLNFKLEDTDTKILASPRIRARNKEKAKIMIGDRVPTVTNSVTPISTGSAVVTGNVSYQDVGLKLEFESQVYGNSEVGIKINLEVSNIAKEFTDSNGGRSYQIGTRNASTNLRLKDGETQVLGGLISDQDRNTASLIPGLGHLPIIGRLFGNNDGSDTRSEIVLAVTPRIIRDVPVASLESREIFSGTANMVRERPILADPVGELKVTGTFGGNAGPARAATFQGLPPPTEAGAPPSSGQVLFNPQPAQPTATMPETGSLLPTPPPMYVRPPPVTSP